MSSRNRTPSKSQPVVKPPRREIKANPISGHVTAGLFALISELHDAIGALEARCVALRMPMPPMACNDVPPTNSPMAELIATAQSRIADARDRIYALGNSIDGDILP